ncbi:hypothetical protein Nepgr_021679 [Nepenthes gracilis]|uniref:Uncharacterized protein n=1 Tax=Nepenthes gracilis TaxID=150966 RepID=A0AAD3SYN4_NEPGR|nr:hypothetical protein Nepgr_021679 [Nepenthes gracilis]
MTLLECILALGGRTALKICKGWSSVKNCPFDQLPAVLVPSIVSDPLIPSGPPQLNCSECSLVDSKLKVVIDCPSSVTGLESSGTPAILRPDSNSGSNGSATGFKVEAPAPLDQFKEKVECFVDGCNSAYSGMGAGPLYADSSGANGISHADAVVPETTKFGCCTSNATVNSSALWVQLVAGPALLTCLTCTYDAVLADIHVPQPAVNVSDEGVDSEMQPGAGYGATGLLLSAGHHRAGFAESCCDRAWNDGGPGLLFMDGASGL